jgi:alkanesulfonate monooxygenase SsuD/methylene tetrahydromethanopterin reductase-like flavin-dependent oxidoreductase (luciferase family)
MALTLGLLMPMVASGLPAGRLVEELVAEARAAERSGFDACLVPEHHRGPEGSLTDPVTLSAWLLASTERLRIGPGVLVAPLHHPVRLAEQAAILQQASGGRLLLGVGAGYQPADFELFGEDLAGRKAATERLLRLLGAAWRGEPVVAGHRVVPSLGACTAPEVWLGSWSRPGIRLAGELSDGWLVDPIRDHAEIVRMASWYREAAAAAVRRPRVVAIRHCWVAATDAAAAAEYGPVVEPIYRYYLRAGAFGADPPPERELVLGKGLEDRVICGSPATVTDRLVDFLESVGGDGALLALRHPGGPPHTAVLEAVELLGAEVLPAVRRRLGSAGAGAYPAGSA